MLRLMFIFPTLAIASLRSWNNFSTRERTDPINCFYYSIEGLLIINIMILKSVNQLRCDLKKAKEIFTLSLLKENKSQSKV